MRRYPFAKTSNVLSSNKLYVISIPLMRYDGGGSIGKEELIDQLQKLESCFRKPCLGLCSENLSTILAHYMKV